MKNLNFLVKPVFAQEAGEFDEIIGTIDVPKGVDLINQEVGVGNIGILLFFSKIIQIMVVISSIWVVINIVTAAYTYLTGEGKPDSHKKVSDLLTSSVVGLIIIVSSYTIAGLIGLLFFGDPTYVINPTIAPITGL